MGKVSFSLATLFVMFFVGAASVDASSQATPWYLRVLWGGAIIFAALSVLAGLIYVFLRCRGYRTAIRIGDDWRCTYWPSERRLQVTFWFDDHSDAAAYGIKCSAQFGQTIVHLDEDIEVGGTYLGRRSFVSGKTNPIMVELRKSGVELDRPQTTVISLRIQPDGLLKGAAKEAVKTASVRIVGQ